MTAMRWDALAAGLAGTQLNNASRAALVDAESIGEFLQNVLDSLAFDRRDARSFMMAEDQTPAYNRDRLNEAIAWSAAYKTAISLSSGSFPCATGLLAMSGARVIADTATLLMSGTGTTWANAVGGQAVNDFQLIGLKHINDPAVDNWDGNAVNLYGDRNYLERVAFEGYALTGGRAFSGGGTFKVDVALQTTSGSAVVRAPRDFFRGDDVDRRMEIPGAGAAGTALQAWIKPNSIHNEAYADYSTCELYNRATGASITASATLSAAGWIDRCGSGTTAVHCRWKNNTTSGKGSAGIRVNHGGSRFLFCEVDAGDDAAFQCVPGMGGGFGTRQTIEDVLFLYCRGGSSAAKLVSITNGGGGALATDWHDTRKIQFIGVPGYAGGRALHVENSNNDQMVSGSPGPNFGESGRGRVWDITFRDVLIEMGEADQDSRAPYGLNFLNKTTVPQGTGNIKCQNVVARSSWHEAMQLEGSLGPIWIGDGCELGPTRKPERPTVKIASPDVQLYFTGRPRIYAPDSAVVIDLQNATAGGAFVDLGKASILGITNANEGLKVDGPYRVIADGAEFMPAAGQTAATGMTVNLNRACDVKLGALCTFGTAIAITTSGSSPGTFAQLRVTRVIYDDRFTIADGASITWVPPAGKTAGWLLFVENKNKFSFGFDMTGTPSLLPGENLGSRFTTALTTASRINLAATLSGITVENLTGGPRTIAVEMIAA